MNRSDQLHRAALTAALLVTARNKTQAQRLCFTLLFVQQDEHGSAQQLQLDNGTVKRQTSNSHQCYSPKPLSLQSRPRTGIVSGTGHGPGPKQSYIAPQLGRHNHYVLLPSLTLPQP